MHKSGDLHYAIRAMNVRAKFTVTGVKRNFSSYRHHETKELVVNEGAVTITLQPVYDQSIPEDQRFQKATPWGEISLNIDNPVAVDALKPGHSFYVDFTPAE